MARPVNIATPAQLRAVLGDADRPRRTNRQPERYFTDRVKRYAKRGLWLPYHNLHAKGSDPGFLDLLLFRLPRLVIAELKVPPNVRPSDWQEVWLAYWRVAALLSGPALRIEVYTWVPDDWPEIEEVLR